MILTSQNLRYSETFNQVAPRDGSKSMKISVPFTALIDTYTLDLGQTQHLARFSMLQGLFVDNANNGSQIVVTELNTGHRLIVPANSQAFLPILSKNPVQLQFVSAGAVTVEIDLLNFPIAPCVWAV